MPVQPASLPSITSLLPGAFGLSPHLAPSAVCYEDEHTLLLPGPSNPPPASPFQRCVRFRTPHHRARAEASSESIPARMGTGAAGERRRLRATRRVSTWVSSHLPVKPLRWTHFEGEEMEAQRYHVMCPRSLVLLATLFLLSVFPLVHLTVIPAQRGTSLGKTSLDALARATLITLCTTSSGHLEQLYVSLDDPPVEVRLRHWTVPSKRERTHIFLYTLASPVNKTAFGTS